MIAPEPSSADDLLESFEQDCDRQQAEEAAEADMGEPGFDMWDYLS